MGERFVRTPFLIVSWTKNLSTHTNKHQSHAADPIAVFRPQLFNDVRGQMGAMSHIHQADGVVMQDPEPKRRPRDPDPGSNPDEPGPALEPQVDPELPTSPE